MGKIHNQTTSLRIKIFLFYIGAAVFQFNGVCTPAKSRAQQKTPTQHSRDNL
jgi:hypothetical protein